MPEQPDRSERLVDLARLFRFTPLENKAAESMARLGLKVDPEFKNAIAEFPTTGKLDEWGALHQSIFGFNVFPFASVFLEKDGKMGGDIGDQAARTYARAEFYDAGSESPDHLVTQLLFCAHHQNQRGNFEASYAQFLDHHVFPWISGFSFAVQRRTKGYYADLVRLTIEILIQERQSTGETFNQEGPDEYAESTGSAEHNSDKESSSRDIADHFASAATCGLLLSRDDISDLAAAARIPAGFGSRVQRLTTLFDSARQYNRVAELTAALDSILVTEQSDWLDLVGNNEVEALKFWQGVWSDRLSNSRQYLQEFASAE